MQQFLDSIKNLVSNYLAREYSSPEITKSSFALGLMYAIFIYILKKNNIPLFNYFTLSIALFAFFLAMRLVVLILRNDENKLVYAIGLIPLLAIFISIPILNSTVFAQ